MSDPVAAVLEKLGVPAGPDALAALDAFLRREPGRSGAAVDRLLEAAARETRKELAGRALVALGSAHLARGDAAKAREALVEGAALLSPEDRAAAAVAALRAGLAENALANPKAARAALARSAVAVLSVGRDDLAAELAQGLRQAGETLAADVVEHGRRATKTTSGGDPRASRLDVLVRVMDALSSASAGTAEPLHAVLRAILEEAGADRGFLLVQDDDALRFELGLTRSGRQLGADGFSFSTSVVERALETGKPVLVPDLTAALPFALASSARDLGLRSAVCAPLRVDRRRFGATPAAALPAVKGIAGVLYVDAAAAGSFGEADAPFFDVLADAAVLALRLARAEEALRAAAAQDEEPGAPRRAPARRGRALRVPSRVEEVTLDHPYEELVTQDPGLRSVLKLVDRVTASDASVLIRGESGTGKELIARAIHRHGRRKSGPFVAIDGGSIPDTLIQHELFGHEKNAFTGAGDEKPGLLERAHGGTLFLDEVSELSPALQASLLRVLQQGELRRIGGERLRQVDVRLIATTSRDLKLLVEQGVLRHDLLFRLSVVNVDVPPLRDRAGDVPLLARHLLRKIAPAGTPPLAIEPPAIARLEEHDWPGNVRELENVLRAAAVVAKGPIALKDVSQVLGSAGEPGLVEAGPDQPALEGTMEEIERRAIADRLRRLGWNQLQAAKSLGMDRNTLHRKIVRYGIVRGRE